jgi:hypothetical protein
VNDEALVREARRVAARLQEHDVPDGDILAAHASAVEASNLVLEGNTILDVPDDQDWASRRDESRAELHRLLDYWRPRLRGGVPVEEPEE